MSIARVKTWVAGEVLAANDLNNEFNNITVNALLEPFVATQQVDINGQLLLLDADGDTLLDGSTNNVVTMNVAGAADFRWAANNFTALAGSDITMAGGRLLQVKGADIASGSTITVPPDGNVVTITGTTTITAFSTTQAGTMFYCRFTGAGLNITHNATSMISPWARDYRTVQNEILAFLSLGSGNYTFWSLNGPNERVGVTIEANVSSAPAGYLAEDGVAISRTTYSGLFAEIGTTFGVGDGSTTFNVPLTHGLTVINRDPSNSVITSASTNGANAATLGGKGGSQTHTLTTAESPAHTHPQTERAGAGGVGFGPVASTTPTASVDATQSTGGGGAHSNTQPWIAKAKFIRF